MEKAALRKQFLAERRALPAEEVELRSQRIAAIFFEKFSRFFAFPKNRAITVIHTFLPIFRQKEINTWLIVRRLWADFPALQVVAPVTDFANGSMANYVIRPETVFEENRFGIPEPVVERGAWGEEHGARGIALLAPRSLPPAQIDLVLVPLLIVDKQGNRVGYGGGFYDRFLAQCRSDCLKVGVSLFEPIECIDDMFEGDISLDYCLTPKQIWCFQDCMPI